MQDTYNAADTAWVLVCAALVLLMTPGLALFYGGMVRAKSVLNMIMMSFVAHGPGHRAVGPLRVLDGLRPGHRARPGRVASRRSASATP